MPIGLTYLVRDFGEILAISLLKYTPKRYNFLAFRYTLTSFWPKRCQSVLIRDVPQKRGWKAQSKGGEPSGFARLPCFESMAVVFAIDGACLLMSVRLAYSPHAVSLDHGSLGLALAKSSSLNEMPSQAGRDKTYSSGVKRQRNDRGVLKCRQKSLILVHLGHFKAKNSLRCADPRIFTV